RLIQPRNVARAHTTLLLGKEEKKQQQIDIGARVVLQGNTGWRNLRPRIKAQRKTPEWRLRPVLMCLCHYRAPTCAGTLLEVSGTGIRTANAQAMAAAATLRNMGLLPDLLSRRSAG